MDSTTARTAPSRRTRAGSGLSTSDSLVLVLCVLATVVCTVLDVSPVATWAFAGAAAAGGLTAAVRARRAGGRCG
ncbi:hypothetical protein NUM3379_22240 [Kineococcus sp. NUM-3379]